jgi:hypothetical protein
MSIADQFVPRVGITPAGVTIRCCSTEMSPIVTRTGPTG